LNSLEILYKEYDNYWLYPISKTVYFKRTYSHSGYTEYELICGGLSFYATNNHLFPLRLYNNRMQEQYIASVQFGTGKDRPKVVYHEETGERYDLVFSEYKDFSTNEVRCKRHGIRLFELSENTFTFSHPKLVLKGTIEGHELELFISFLCFFIKYDEEFYG
jgi:hypothetical protein